MVKILFLLSLYLILAANSLAAIKTWDGGGSDNNWRTAENWVDKNAPVEGDDLIFPTVSRQFITNNNLLLYTNFNSIRIEGGNYTINGTPFKLMNGLIINGGNNVIKTSISFLSPLAFTAQSGSFTKIQNIEIDLFSFTIDGNGSFHFEAISGFGTIFKNGPGSSLISSAPGFSGTININDGIMLIDAIIPNTTVFVNTQNISSGLSLNGLSGTGTIGSIFVINGGINAGTLNLPNGILTLNQNMEIQENGVMAVKIGGPQAGENGYDQFKVNGSVILNNPTLSIIPFNDFRPKLNDQFKIIDNDGPGEINGHFNNLPEGARISGPFNMSFEISYSGGDGNDVVVTAKNRPGFDFDGNGKSDVSYFLPDDGTWNIQIDNYTSPQTIPFGLARDRITPADYDGDGKTDIAVFRPSEGTWYILNSVDSSVEIKQFGLIGDIPVPNDFDGDGRADLGLYRPKDGTWYQLRSVGNQFYTRKFGRAGDIPLMGDFDGDGRGDLAVFRKGYWHLLKSSEDSYQVIRFGISSDIPLTGDFDGDGMADFGIFRGNEDSSQPDFYILSSNDYSFRGISWGLPDDLPVVADYDGDGQTDIAVFRPTTNDWYLLNSTDGFTQTRFGENGNQPIPTAFLY